LLIAGARGKEENIVPTSLGGGNRGKFNRGNDRESRNERIESSCPIGLCIQPTGWLICRVNNYKKVWPLTRYTYGQPYLWISSEPRPRYSQLASSIFLLQHYH